MSQKKISDGVHFLHEDKYQIFYKLALLFLMKVTRHVQSTQNRKLVTFLKYLKKTVSRLLFVFYCDAKHSDILRVSSHVGCANQIAFHK